MRVRCLQAVEAFGGVVGRTVVDVHDFICVGAEALVDE
jgi:hypothetical protein